MGYSSQVKLIREAYGAIPDLQDGWRDVRETLLGMNMEQERKLSYQRKTHNTWEVQGLYSGEWELETCEDSRREALARLREYRENMPQYAHRLRMVRERIEQEAGQ